MKRMPGNTDMDIQNWVLIGGALGTLLGAITSTIVGFFLMRSQRRKENALAANNEAEARNIDVKSEVDLSDAALRIVKELRLELDRMKIQIEEARTQIDKLQAETLEIRRENMFLRSENDSLKIRVHDLETENTTLRSEIEKLKNGH